MKNSKENDKSDESELKEEQKIADSSTPKWMKNSALNQVKNVRTQRNLVILNPNTKKKSGILDLWNWQMGLKWKDFFLLQKNKQKISNSYTSFYSNRGSLNVSFTQNIFFSKLKIPEIQMAKRLEAKYFGCKLTVLIWLNDIPLRNVLQIA